ncbi:MAG: hypothetical protein AVO38_15405 [delta proteobacterium ML8_D]|jgi:1,4-dihydroxy-2-naphthoate octaprenyltransferase|nr:MAG: hypothetical protein AVO38_15405 [delta proteobacterium ML8_D]
MKNLITQKLVPYLIHSKPLNALLGAAGILAVFYGMLAKNNLVFIIGIVCIIGGYLLIRRRLKRNYSGR